MKKTFETVQGTFTSVLHFKQAGERTEGKHYLMPVQSEKIWTKHKGQSDLPNGTYIEKCECHPQSRYTRYVEIHNGEYYESGEICYKLE